MNFASKVLVKEHESILKALDILENMVNALNNNFDNEEAKAYINDMVYFLRNFADKCHHGKEEDLFFPALVETGLSKDRGPVGQMLVEHEEGRGYIAQMGKSAEPDTLKITQFKEAATNYINLMREHIQKENTILFPYGDRTLSQDKQAELLDKFEDFETNSIGQNELDKLKGMLSKLGEKYNS